MYGFLIPVLICDPLGTLSPVSSAGTMSSAKWGKFFQEYMQHVAGVGAIGLYFAHVYPHNWGLKKYRSVFSLYQNGEPVPVDKDTHRLAEEVSSVTEKPNTRRGLKLVLLSSLRS